MPPQTLTLLLVGAPVTAFGVFCIVNRSFPGWMTGMWLWPLDRVTADVVAVEGWSAVVLGLTALAYPFVLFAPGSIRLPLGALSVGAVTVSLALMCVATWLSRRPATGRR